MPQGKRRPWFDGDNTALIALWDVVGSVALISIMLHRSRSSVQTQASRLGLPPRSEESDRHRRRWMDGDDEKLENLIIELARPEGIPIQVLAEKMARSVDAVVARIEARYGEDSDVIARLVAPPTPTLPAAGTKPNLVNIGDNALDPSNSKKNPGKVKNCLKCRKNFFSNGNHNWICITCKRSDDWDYD